MMAARFDDIPVVTVRPRGSPVGEGGLERDYVADSEDDNESL